MSNCSGFWGVGRFSKYGVQLGVLVLKIKVKCYVCEVLVPITSLLVHQLMKEVIVIIAASHYSSMSVRPVFTG